MPVLCFFVSGCLSSVLTYFLTPIPASIARRSESSYSIGYSGETRCVLSALPKRKRSCDNCCCCCLRIQHHTTCIPNLFRLVAWCFPPLLPPSFFFPLPSCLQRHVGYCALLHCSACRVGFWCVHPCALSFAHFCFCFPALGFGLIRVLTAPFRLFDNFSQGSHLCCGTMERFVYRDNMSPASASASVSHSLLMQAGGCLALTLQLVDVCRLQRVRAGSLLEATASSSSPSLLVSSMSHHQ